MSAPGGRRPLFPAFDVADYRWYFLSGICWTWARWGLAFLAAFHINEVTDSPRLVQLTGTASWGPMLLGGVVGGVIADRYHRVLIVRVQLLVMVPVAAALGGLELAGRLEVWMVYPLLVVAGLAWVTDMTSRRSLVIDIVGPERLDNAVALDSTSQSSGMIVGNLLGGAMVAALGVGGAFLVLAGLFAAAVCLFWLVPTTYGRPRAVDAAGPLAELRAGAALARRSRPLRGILGVTVIANLFFFGYFPAVQRVGDRLDASPGQIGLLAATTGFGMITAALVIAVARPRRNGRLYVGGMLFAMVMLVAFGQAGSLAVAIAALYVASIGSGFFGATQSALVLSVVDPAVRGRAMGLLGTAIGALPVGSLILGELAELWGIATALTVMTLTGFVALVAWVSVYREVAAMTAPHA